MNNYNNLLNDIMSEKELNNISYVCSKYSIDLKKAYKVRSAYKIIDTLDNIYCLKRMKSGKKKIINSYKLTEDLISNGFTNTPRYLITKKREIYVTHKGYIFLMTEWIDGRECDFSDLEEAKDAVKLLAKFHIASQQINTKGYKLKNCLKNWPEIYNKCIKDMNSYKLTINKKILKNDFDYLYYENIDTFIERSLNSLNLLNISCYYRLSKDAKKQKPICHRSFYYQNVIKKDDTYFLIDLNRIIIDLRINDLGRFIRRLMDKKYYNWNFEKAKELIMSYNSVYPLSKEELEIMLSLIMFPHKFWKLGKKRYKKHKKWTETKYRKKLDKILESIEKQDIFYKEYIYFLNKYK